MTQKVFILMDEHLRGGEHFRGEMTSFSKSPAVHPAIRPDDQPGQGGVLQGQAQPGFRGELESTAGKVPNNIGMADNDLIAVFLLVGLCSVEILPEGGFYPGTILLSVHLDIVLRNFLGLWCNGGTFSQDAVFWHYSHFGE